VTKAGKGRRSRANQLACTRRRPRWFGLPRAQVSVVIASCKALPNCLAPCDPKRLIPREKFQDRDLPYNVLSRSADWPPPTRQGQRTVQDRYAPCRCDTVPKFLMLVIMRTHFDIGAGQESQKNFTIGNKKILHFEPNLSKSLVSLPARRLFI
jgi:hypothetical protein